MIGIGSWFDRPRTQLPWTVNVPEDIPLPHHLVLVLSFGDLVSVRTVMRLLNIQERLRGETSYYYAIAQKSSLFKPVYWYRVYFLCYVVQPLWKNVSTIKYIIRHSGRSKWVSRVWGLTLLESKKLLVEVPK